MRLLPLALALLLTSCGPEVGDSYETADGRSSVRVVASGGCDDVRSQAPEIAERERQWGLDLAETFAGVGMEPDAGPIDSSAVSAPTVEDLTPYASEAPSSCVAFVVTSGWQGGALTIATVPEEIVIMNRASFLDGFVPKE